MKTISKFLLVVCLPLIAAAQTTTPNTTLCAAVSTTATSLCLSSTTGVVNQTGLYVDGELMLVQLSNSQVLSGSNVYVPVARAQRAGTVPAIHNSGAVVWVAQTPGSTIVPGDNGFIYSTQYSDVGPCVRGNYTYLPHIWPDRGVIRDCSGTGFWVDYDPNLNVNITGSQPGLVSASGALTVTSGTYVITDTGVAVLTLAAPTSGVQDGTIIRISSATAHAHTLTATGLLQTGSASVNLATFAAQAGAGLTLMAYQGKWIVLYSIGITFS